MIVLEVQCPALTLLPARPRSRNHHVVLVGCHDTTALTQGDKLPAPSQGEKQPFGRRVVLNPVLSSEETVLFEEA